LGHQITGVDDSADVAQQKAQGSSQKNVKASILAPEDSEWATW